VSTAAHTTTLPVAPTTREEGARLRDVVRIGLFALALSIPLLTMLLGLDRGPQLTENRRLSARPTLVLRPRELAALPGQFRFYFSDHFGFRSTLIHLQGVLDLRVFGVLPRPDVTMGEDGWLFLAGERSTECYRRTDLFTDADLESWRRGLERRQTWLAARGAAFFFVIAPDKETIYGEKMPAMLTQVAPRSRLDQLVDYLRERSTVRIVDLRSALLAGKNDGRIYNKTDTHWNDQGAFLGYRELMRQVGQVVPTARVLGWDDFDVSRRLTDGMDLTWQLGLSDVFREERIELKPKRPLPITTPDQNDLTPIMVGDRGTGRPAVVVFRDSFFTNVVPWLAESFGRGVYLWQDRFDAGVVKQVDPKIVIQEIAERKLMLEPGDAREAGVPQGAPEAQQEP
jgi:hypothetical protein